MSKAFSIKILSTSVLCFCSIIYTVLFKRFKPPLAYQIRLFTPSSPKNSRKLSIVSPFAQ